MQNGCSTDSRISSRCHYKLFSSPNDTQRSTNSYFKKSAQKSSILGIETAIFLLKTHGRKWGGFAPHLRPWVLRSKMAVSTKKIGDFRADFLKSEFLDLWAFSQPQARERRRPSAHCVRPSAKNTRDPVNGCTPIETL
jgi:hypothetical protein